MRYELSVPYTPLGLPSEAYQKGWERVFGTGKKRAKARSSHKVARCRTPAHTDPTPHRTSTPRVRVQTPSPKVFAGNGFTGSDSAED